MNVNFLFKLGFCRSYYMKYLFTGQNDPTSKYLYNKANETIDKWTTNLHTFLFKISIPIAIIPTLLVSYYFYFATDMGGEAFIFPSLMK